MNLLLKIFVSLFLLLAFLPGTILFARNTAFDQFGSRDWSQRIAQYKAAHPLKTKEDKRYLKNKNILQKQNKHKK